MPVPDTPAANDGFEPVYVELDWYDGPQAGVAAVQGAPHYFRCVHDQALRADFRLLDRAERYHVDGPDYLLRWR